jgi:hypothetical protein
VFEYNGEKFNTGVEKIDAYEELYSITVELMMDVGSGSYMPGEEVSQVGGYSGTVVAFIDNKLILNKVSGELDENQPIIGEDSMTSRMIAKVETETGRDSLSNDNPVIDELVDDGLISFAERNPLLDN